MDYKVRISTLKTVNECNEAIEAIENNSSSYKGGIVGSLAELQDRMKPQASDKIERINWRAEKLVLVDYKEMTADQFGAKYGVDVTELITNEELVEQI